MTEFIQDFKKTYNEILTNLGFEPKLGIKIFIVFLIIVRILYFLLKGLLKIFLNSIMIMIVFLFINWILSLFGITDIDNITYNEINMGVFLIIFTIISNNIITPFFKSK